MEEVTEGVHQVKGGYVNSYIVDGDDGVVLIDTGMPNKHQAVADRLGSIGRSVADIAVILLTHSHNDHTGGVAALKTGSGARVIASATDAPAIRGQERPPAPPMFPGWLSWIPSLMPSATPVKVDVELDGEDGTGLPGDFGVVATPGHTPGHVSFLLDRGGGTLFVGDAAAADKSGEIRRGFPNGRGNPVVDGSIRHIAEYEFERALFGHSASIMTGASAAFRRF